jgi:hypothetical protein
VILQVRRVSFVDNALDQRNVRLFVETQRREVRLIRKPSGEIIRPFANFLDAALGRRESAVSKHPTG